MFKFGMLLFFLMLFILLMLGFQIKSSGVSKTFSKPQPIETLNPPKFKDVTLASGITHSHIQNIGQVTDLIDTTHSGACVADFDNDGWQDLLFMAGGGQTRFYGKSSWWQDHDPVILYQNKQGLFTKIRLAQAKLLGSTTACSAADFDQDGLIDFVVGTTENDYLFINKGDFEFEQDPDYTQIAGESWTSHISHSDINNDGLVDLHLSKFLKYRQNQKNLEISSGFSEQHHLQMDPGKFDGLENKILINKGKGKFVEMTKELGISGNPERTISSLWADLNQDGRVDLLEHNLGDQPVRSYLQNKNGLFEPVVQANWGMRANNVNYSIVGKQIFDLSLSWFATRPTGLSSLYKPLLNLNHDASWEFGLMTHDRTFQYQWGSVLADFNNDGYGDLAIASGGKQSDIFSPKMAVPMANLCATRRLSESRGTQTAFSVEVCSQQRLMSSRSVIELDYNNDGKIDLLFLANNDFPQLLENVTEEKANWIALEMPLGSQIELIVGDHKQVYFSHQNQALFGTHDPRIHIGLGAINEVEVRVIFKNSRTSYAQSLSANTYYNFEGEKWHIGKATSPLPAITDNNESRDLHKTWNHLDAFVLNSFDRPKSPTWFEKASSLLENQDFEQLSRLADTISRHQEYNAIPFYLVLIEHTNSDLADAAAHVLARLENEHSASILLSKLDTQDAKVFCRVAAIFAQWLDEEEAVNRGKGRAIPFFIRGLQQSNQQIVSCSAQSLGVAEYINGAFAIMDVIHNVSASYQKSLVIALGKIRQKEAIDDLLKIIKINPIASVKQQVLIALTRLDYQFMDNLIADMHEDPSLWLAILTISDAEEGIVLPVATKETWLKQLTSRNLRDFELPENRSLYFQALSNKRLTASKDRLLGITEFDKENVDLANALLSLSSMPDDLFQVLLSLELNLDQLTKIKNTLEQRRLSDAVDAHAITNLLSQFSYLNGLQKNTLFTLIEGTPDIVLNEQVIVSFLRTCMVNKIEIDKATMASWSNELLNLMVACDIFNALEKEEKIEKLQLFVNKLSSGNDLQSTLKLVMLNTSVLDKVQMNKLSSLVLYRTGTHDSIKSKWAIQHISSDNLSRAWLRKQVGSGNQKLLEQLIDAQVLEQLGENNFYESLLINTILSEEMKYRLNGIIRSSVFAERVK